MPRIQLTTTDGTSLEFEISSSRARFGRAEDNDFVVPDGSVSSHHGEIFANGDAIELIDHGSTNGTFVGGTRVENGTVNPGEHFRLGQVEGFVFELPGAAGAEESLNGDGGHEEHGASGEWNPLGGAEISGLGATPCPTGQRVGFGPKVKKKGGAGTLLILLASVALIVCAVVAFMITRMNGS